MRNAKSIKLKRIDLSKKDGCKHPDISAKKFYIVNYDGAIIYGQFVKEWYGWNFQWFGMTYAGLQLDTFYEVWEVQNPI